MKTLNQKLLEIQKEIGGIKKEETNPFFKSKYFDVNALLEHVKPVLNNHGVVILQALSSVNGNLALATSLIDSESGEKISDVCPLPETVDAQKAGAAITYFRRYAIQSLLALEALDDDANSVSGENRVKVPYKPVAVKKAEFEQNKADRDNGVPAF